MGVGIYISVFLAAITAVPDVRLRAGAQSLSGTAA